MPFRWTVVAILTLGTLLPMVAGGQECVEPPTGMTAWWPGDGNAADIFGTWRGTLVGDTTYGSGEVDQAFSFDGTGDYVEISNANAGNFGGDPFSVDFWMYANSMGSTDTYLIGKSHPDGGQGWDIRLGDGTIKVSGVNGWSFNIVSAAIVTTGTWHHVAMTATGADVILYIDGAEAGSSGRSTITTASNPLRFGFTTNYGGVALNGLIDEVEIFDRALSADDVLAIYNAGAAGKCRPCTALPDGAVSWWRGEDDATDATGTYDGTLVGDTTYAVGMVGQAFSFDGSGDYVQISDSSAGDFGADPFTVNFWMYSNAAGVREYVLGKSNPNIGGAGWDIRLDAQAIVVGGVDEWGEDIRSDASATAGAWHHIAVTATTTDVELYIDGVVKGSSPRSTILTDPDPLRFGDNPNYGDDGLNGRIDEVEIFDRALTVDEIEAMFNAGASGICTSCTDPRSDLVSWWRGEDEATDATGTYDGTLVGGTTYAVGMVGQAFSFDGSGDYVQISDSSAGDFGADPFTVDFWMYSNAAGVREYVLGKSNPNIGGAGWDIRLDAQAIVVGGVDEWGEDIRSDASATAGAWHHIAVTATTTDVELYIDGVVKGSSARSTILTEPDPLRFGDNPNYGDPGLNGLIDEVEIFDRALSRDEIVAIYNAGSHGTCPLDSEPDVFGFTDLSAVPMSSTEVSDTIAVSGINVAAAISLDSCTSSSCQYSVNSASWTSAAGSVEEGDQVEVRQTSAATYGATTDLILDIGGVTDTFSVTTLYQFTLTISLAGTGSGTVTSSPAGINCGVACNEVFIEGTLVTLTATRGSGSAFVGWSGAPDCADGEVTITTDIECTATFEPAIFEDGFESGNTSAWSTTVP